MKTYLLQLWHDIKYAWSTFRYARMHLRKGGNPDQEF